ncbi:hypothetical protein AcdelDRAFT_4555 [Acidovorax delafieldii 2AN]|uniref:Uncharacterized protein n=1 Tax=Acidovorax delafieldii 2AN TaxID=573060 RepID=C5TCC4_ACIDE|nr:hypothetical protein AcdelDRAFT_4555 [Acidovorax delafieldii 2AN]
MGGNAPQSRCRLVRRSPSSDVHGLRATGYSEQGFPLASGL